MANPLRTFRAAQRFHNAAFILNQFATQQEDPDFIFPDVVCGALAPELYFKCLVTLETGATPRGHDLVNLFHRLDPTSQASMRKHFANAPPLTKQMRQLISQKIGREIDFDYALHSSRDAFVYWRYFHEDHRRIGPAAWFGGDMLDGARDLILRLGASLQARAFDVGVCN